MTRSDLYAYMEQPSQLTAETLPQMKALYEAYPYCHTFVFLYLYNLYMVKDLRYPSELKRLAPFLPDRRKLYLLVEEQSQPEQLQPTPQHDVSDPFSLIDSFLNEMEQAGADLPQDIASSMDAPALQVSYFSDELLAAESHAEALELSKPAQPVEVKAPAAAKQNEANELGEDLEESLFTETLAKIYIQQGRYDKALRIIRSISLNYPEKNRYFAVQIRFLEKLIAIEQKHKK